MHLTFYSKIDLCLDQIGVQMTEDGWYLDNERYTGHCDKGGSPILNRCLRENRVDYPPALFDALEELWHSIRRKRLSEPEVQASLDCFSHWILSYERTHCPRPIEA